MSGGVSCEVWIERDLNGCEIVVKQALPKLKVTADWRASPDRYEVEVRALEAARKLLGDHVAPRVLWVDAIHHRFAMERIDSRLRNWKDDLLKGQVNMTTAARVGELLGLLHTRSANHPDYAIEFGNRQYFEELRIEPFFKRIAERNPDLADAVSMAIAALRRPGTALVHGDFSPKNLLVAGQDVVILDWEVAHWGNPRFDVAFCLTHLLLKAFRRGVDSLLYISMAHAFIFAYRPSGVGAVLDAELVRILGCLGLARFEGDSPIDYLAEIDTSRIKPLFCEWIRHPQSDVERALDVAQRWES